MATITPSEGLEWFVRKSLNESGVVDEKIYDVGVGSGSGSPVLGDTQLDQQEYRTNADSSNVTIENTSPDLGELEVRITINGGTEVPAGTTITEFGLWARDPALPQTDFTIESGETFPGDIDDANDIMVYREERTGVTIDSGDQKTFLFKIEVVN